MKPTGSSGTPREKALGSWRFGSKPIRALLKDFRPESKPSPMGTTACIGPLGDRSFTLSVNGIVPPSPVFGSIATRKRSRVRRHRAMGFPSTMTIGSLLAPLPRPVPAQPDPSLPPPPSQSGAPRPDRRQKASPHGVRSVSYNGIVFHARRRGTGILDRAHLFSLKVVF